MSSSKLHFIAAIRLALKSKESVAKDSFLWRNGTSAFYASSSLTRWKFVALNNCAIEAGSDLMGRMGEYAIWSAARFRFARKAHFWRVLLNDKLPLTKRWHWPQFGILTLFSLHPSRLFIAFSRPIFGHCRRASLFFIIKLADLCQSKSTRRFQGSTNEIIIHFVFSV